MGESPLLVRPSRPYEIDGYVLFEELGRGCMKTVYLAHHPEYFDNVALALVEPSPNWNWERRFVEEVASFRKLPPHQNIIGFYGGGMANLVRTERQPEREERLYFCMELADLTLVHYLGHTGMDVCMARKWMLDISDAAQHAHNHNILHRDIKPENILIGNDGLPKLSDFGFVKDLTREIHWTETRHGLGTEGYVAPEQVERVESRVIDVASDVYSLGAVLLEMLVGRARFVAHINECQRKSSVRSYATLASLMGQVEQQFRETKQEARLQLLAIARRCVELELRKRLPRVSDLKELLSEAGEHRAFRDVE